MDHQHVTSLLRCSFAAFISHPNTPFTALFIFRYLRLIVHMVSFWYYKDSPIPAISTITERDVTVIIPTVEPTNHDFLECLASVLVNGPSTVHIVTVGAQLRRQTCEIVAPFVPKYPSTAIRVSCTTQADKRKQIAHVLPRVTTPLTVLVDDHVFWPSGRFLSTAVAAFEDPAVGGVGTNKRVRRHNHPFGLTSFFNVLGALYLERHNFEIRATNAIDGGVFVISGRTCAYRTQILQSPEFLRGYLHETFFFGRFGPLNADDDNYITRAVVERGWKVKIQYSADAMIETTVGTYPKFLSQCLRWARTTWRSNPASLRSWTVWRTQPWCVYAVYLTSFVNFALFYDAALFWTLSRSELLLARHDGNASYVMLGAWIFMTKMVKLVSYFRRHPRDLVYLPGCVAFAYFHSMIKLYALCTFWVTAWGSRDLASIGGDSTSDSEADPPVELGVEGSSTFDTEFFSMSSGLEDYISDTASGGGTIATTTVSGDGGSSLHNRRPNSGGKSITTPWGRVGPGTAAYLLPANVLLDTRAQTRTSTSPPPPRRRVNTTNRTADHRPGKSKQIIAIQQQQQLRTPRLEAVDGPDDLADAMSPLTLSAPEQDCVQDQAQLATPAATPPREDQPCPISDCHVKRVRIDPYARAWARAAKCQRLHHSGLYIVAGGACALQDKSVEALTHHLETLGFRSAGTV
ncbi:hypothetical protein PV08_09053 [Exophiala spinifera]|uniref:Uncharacterized protein n=1 Tax=Exophiala spinifera TaxID=91928 RepID=A0A0D1Y9Z6_9EURO|nr:uncharacterized protein PV08_09053 [Exophiala spinifera]KIW11781.1 hypothetical protein PV08_09053 [Exophiala spinifera]